MTQPTPEALDKAANIFGYESWGSLQRIELPITKHHALTLAQAYADLEATKAELAETKRVLGEVDAECVKSVFEIDLAHIRNIAAPYRVKVDPLDTAAREAIEAVWQHGTPRREEVIATVAAKFKELKAAAKGEGS